jgi:predicted transcriptional regulator
MLKASASTEWLPLFEALSSKVRLRIIALLSDRPMNNKQLAAELQLSGAIISMHIKKLQEAGIIQSEMVRRDGGTHKMNSLAIDAVEVAFPHRKPNARPFHEVSIPVGHYTHFDVHPTCGLAAADKLIGQLDDPRYFLHPERMHANILWFGKGFVEYKVPNYLLPSQRISEIEISMEIGSEAPGVNGNWPSDIRFYLNGTDVGCWTSPGDSGNGRGTFSPDWWIDDLNQYGYLKVIRVNENGTFLDGQQISATSLSELRMERNHWTFRLAVEDDAVHVGGLTLYGTGFGNYNQDIVFRTYYEAGFAT